MIVEKKSADDSGKKIIVELTYDPIPYEQLGELQKIISNKSILQGAVKKLTIHPVAPSHHHRSN